jgi:hypothetical protein
MADIQISDVTTTLPDGDGVFDVLMRSVDSHLDKQYQSGRIKGSDYATVYLGALQMVLQQAIQFVLAEQKAEKELDALDEQIAASQAATAVKEDIAAAQVAVYTKQEQGFDRDYKYKIVKSLLDIRTTGLTQGNEGITSEGGDTLIKELLTEVGLTFNAYSGGSVTTGTGQFLVDPA